MSVEATEEARPASSEGASGWRVVRWLLAAPFAALGAYEAYVGATYLTHGGGELGIVVLVYGLAMLGAAWGMAMAKTLRWTFVSIASSLLLIACAILFIRGLSRAHW